MIFAVADFAADGNPPQRQVLVEQAADIRVDLSDSIDRTHARSPVSFFSSASACASAAGLSSTEEGELPSPHGEGEPPATAGDEVFPPTGENVVQSRDYYAEWQELAEAHPEVVGKELPEDIYQACMQSELPPLRVYESMMLQKQAYQISALQQEIATLRQNAENTARAPVVAAAEGPANEPEDLFMKGFNSY